MKRPPTLTDFFLASLCVLTPASCLAQGYPNKPIRVVYPYPGGAVVDVIGRMVSQGVSEILGQPLVPENRGGANGIIGMEHVARAAPDGYVISFTTASALLFNSFISNNVPYDPLRDFTAITAAVEAPITTIVHASVPANSLRELIDHLKRNPGKPAYGSFGNGSIAHLMGELIKGSTGTDMLHVPYKGAAAVITDITVGRIDITFLTVGGVLQLWRAGKVRILTVNTAKRFAPLPDLPAITEELPGIELLVNWYGFVGPAAMPPSMVRQLNGAIVKVLNAPEVRKKVEDLFHSAIANTPEEFAASLKKEFALAGKIVKTAGIKPE